MASSFASNNENEVSINSWEGVFNYQGVNYPIKMQTVLRSNHRNLRIDIAEKSFLDGFIFDESRPDNEEFTSYFLCEELFSTEGIEDKAVSCGLKFFFVDLTSQGEINVSLMREDRIVANFILTKVQKNYLTPKIYKGSFTTPYIDDANSENIWSVTLVRYADGNINYSAYTVLNGDQEQKFTFSNGSTGKWTNEKFYLDFYSWIMRSDGVLLLKPICYIESNTPVIENDNTLQFNVGLYRKYEDNGLPIGSHVINAVLRLSEINF